jgi:hypothetical protein
MSNMGVNVLTSGKPDSLAVRPVVSFVGPESSTPELCETCLDQPVCARILRHLGGCPTTVMTVPDMAGCLGLPSFEVQDGIDTLDRRGLLRRVSVGDLAFYGITDDPRKLKTVSRFRDWCNEQRQEWTALQKVLG